MRQLPDDYTVRLVDMPTSVGGRISETPDGHIDIYINARWGYNGQHHACDHELDHWENDDLHNDLDIRIVEMLHGRQLPKLMKARDLIPKPRPKPQPAPRPRLTPRQLAAIRRALADLDKICLNDAYTY